MKITLSAVVLLLLVIACSEKKSSSPDEWPGMDTFHMIMAESYHPLKDSANLAPAKANAKSPPDAITKARPSGKRSTSDNSIEWSSCMWPKTTRSIPAFMIRKSPDGQGEN